ncbi:hypothetical protein SAMN06295912_12015 [Sphingomonas laterariae]|uniref:ACT domain-containing protein n=1 Tax=Edaphosphingomonas laterariae TaxID=861865 RepID=A0A239HYE7_9SPHN|nr:hypothetical protein [Sphingomonas laterariae]SNS86506.1 hypothetical protein SAMN06295912_12015 [Sphingomonas laterariae]
MSGDRSIVDAANICRFEIATDACPQVLARLLGYFAQQDQLISMLHQRMVGDGLRVTLETAWLDPDRARIIAARIGNLLAVRAVDVRSVAPCDA